MRERHHIAFGPAADGAGEMAPRRGRLAARQHEAGQRREAGVKPVDSGLQAGRLFRPDAQFRSRRLIVRLRHTQIGAHVEEVVLNAANQVGFGRIGMMRGEQSEDGIQLVHAAVSRDARMVLGDAAAVAEAGFAAIAGLGVDARKIDHANARASYAGRPVRAASPDESDVPACVAGA